MEPWWFPPPNYAESLSLCLYLNSLMSILFLPNIGFL